MTRFRHGSIIFVFHIPLFFCTFLFYEEDNPLFLVFQLTIFAFQISSFCLDPAFHPTNLKGMRAFRRVKIKLERSSVQFLDYRTLRTESIVSSVTAVSRSEPNSKHHPNLRSILPSLESRCLRFRNCSE